MEATSDRRRALKGGLLAVAISLIVASPMWLLPSLSSHAELKLGTGRSPEWTVSVRSVGVPVSVDVVDDLVVVAGKDGVAALWRDDGAVRWERDDPGAVVVTQGVVVLHDSASPRTQVKVLDLVTGRERFEVAETADLELAAVSVASQVLLVLRCSDDSRCRLAALSLRDGRQRWSRATERRGTAIAQMPWTYGSPSDERPVGIPVPATSRIAVLVNRSGDGVDRHTVVTTVDVRDGRVLTRRTVGGALNEVWLLGDLLLAVSGCSEARMLDARSLERLWTRPGCVDTTIRIGDVLLDLQGTGMDRLRDVATGDPVWTAGQGATLVGVDADIVVSYVGADADDAGAFDMVVATDRASGRAAWRVRSPARGSAERRFDLGRVGLVGGRIAFDGTERGWPDSPYVLRVMRDTDGASLWHARDTGLLGMGDGWIVGVSQSDSVEPDSPGEIRYFTA